MIKMFGKNSKGQEEMIGFVLIIIIVAVIGLVFLRISLQNPDDEVLESYEINSFLQSILQYHSNCQDNLDYLDIKELIFACSNKEICSNNLDSCEILEEDLQNILDNSWKISGQSPVKGYELNITSSNGEFEDIINLEKGNKTSSSKGANQNFVKSGKSIEIIFKAYY